MANKTETTGVTSAKKSAKVTSRKRRTNTKDDFKNTTINLSSIELSKDWNRETLGDISDLVASISSAGLLNPILVREEPTKNAYVLVDGRRRYAALREMGAVTAPVTISHAKTDKDARLHALVANLTRKDNTPYEVALTFGKLIENDKFTNEKIARSCGCSAGYVSQHLSILKADPQLQDALKAEKIPFAMFRQFAKLDRKVDQAFYEKMVSKALSGDSAQSVGEAIEAYRTRKAAQEAKKAAKAGEKAPKSPAKRGAAAHKKTKKTPELNLQDYRSPEVYKRMKPVKKKDMVDWLDTYRDRAIQSATKAERTYNLGVIDGMEIATGLLVEE